MTVVRNTRPYGAIQSQKFLEELCEKAKTERVVVYPVYGMYPSVTEEVIEPGSYVADVLVGGRMSPALHGPSGRHERFLSDYNVGNHYNENYMFFCKENAESFVETAKTAPDFKRAKYLHEAECKFWDQLFNDDEW